MNRYRILTVTPFFPPDVGGLPNHVFEINKILKNRGNDVTIIAPKHLKEKGFQNSENFRIIRINSIYLPGWPFSTLKSISLPIDFGKKINVIIRNEKFDIVHVHGHHYPISWLAIDAAKNQKIPIILTMHGMWSLNPKILGGKSKIEEIFNSYKFRRILTKVNAVIGQTSKIINYAKKYEKKPIKHFVIPNGVNTKIYLKNFGKKIEFRKKYGIEPSRKVILFATRLEEVKGINEFTSAVEKIIHDKKVEVIIAGTGSLEKFVHQRLGNIKNVHIMGWHPSESIHELYLASDIIVMPSKFEALPLTLLEAMNAGLHIIYTAVGGIPEIINQYSNRTLLSEVSSHEIEGALRNAILRNNTKDIKSSILFARQFDWEKIVDDTISVYENCISKKKIDD